MDKLKMHTPNKADENFAKLAALFPNAVTETIDETTGEVVRAIDKDVLMQEIKQPFIDERCGEGVRDSAVDGAGVDAKQCAQLRQLLFLIFRQKFPREL